MKHKQFLTQSGHFHQRKVILNHDTCMTSANNTLLIVKKGMLSLASIQESIHLHTSQAILLPNQDACQITAFDYAEIILCEWDHVIMEMQNKKIISDHLETELIQALTADSQSDLWQNTLAATLLLSLSRHPDITIRERTSNDMDDECHAIDQYLESHYTQHITLAALAQHLHRNPYALAHLYKKHTGITILDALTQIRLSHALTMVIDKQYSIKEIAQLCGFASTSYFIQRFAKQYHMTPLQYRKHHLRIQEGIG